VKKWRVTVYSYLIDSASLNEPPPPELQQLALNFLATSFSRHYLRSTYTWALPLCIPFYSHSSITPLSQTIRPFTTNNAPFKAPFTPFSAGNLTLFPAVKEFWKSIIRVTATSRWPEVSYPNLFVTRRFVPPGFS